MKKTALTQGQLQSVLLDMLVSLDKVCRENGIRYTLAYGTLLGAVRHKGFIPWDDDIDVSMPRPDYEKLYALYKEGKISFGKHYLLADDRGEHAEYPFLKLMDDRYSVRSRTHIEVPFVYLDIFPVDGVPALSPMKEKMRFAKMVYFDFVHDMTRWYVYDTWWCHTLRVVCFWFWLLHMPYGRRRSVEKLNRLAKKYPFGEYELSDCTAWGATSDPIPASCYDEFVELEFEGHRFLAIKDWDLQLKVRYGDYMTPPPERKRRTEHTMKVYRNETPD